MVNSAYYFLNTLKGFMYFNLVNKKRKEKTHWKKNEEINPKITYKSIKSPYSQRNVSWRQGDRNFYLSN